MSVELDPVELGFKRPFNHEVSQVLRLHNPHNESVAFKVKTTAPKQYSVRPNSGKIDAGKDVEVQVLLQAMKEDPPLDAKCRDKFLVQSVLLSADKDVGTVASIWSQIEQTAKSTIQERKIKVVFLPPDGESHASGPRTNGVANDAHSSARSPSPEAFTPKNSTTQISIAATPTGPITKPDSQGDASRGDIAASASATVASGASVVSGVVEKVSSAVPTSREELKRDLEEAKATIVRLTQQLRDQGGLRQRKADGTSSKDITDSSGSTRSATQPAPTVGGVPVQVTAALCLLCFLLAYFFF